jgi:hypothetical protein
VPDPAIIDPKIRMDAEHRLQDDEAVAWSHGVAKEWADDLGDSRQDIYTLEDGQPVNEPQ